jgi:hypothetical protein
MKILWVNTNFMHPTTKGGQIRTLEERIQALSRRLEAISQGLSPVDAGPATDVGGD